MNVFRAISIVLYFLICFPVSAENGIKHVTNDLPPSSDINVNQSSELVTMDKLIGSTQKLLENQQALRSSIKQFQELQTVYLTDTENKELLLKVAKIALRVSDEIKEIHLEYAFSQEFLSEVSLFAKLAAKRSVPSPMIK
jgi:hypothetical protein